MPFVDINHSTTNTNPNFNSVVFNLSYSIANSSEQQRYQTVDSQPLSIPKEGQKGGEGSDLFPNKTISDPNHHQNTAIASNGGPNGFLVFELEWCFVD